MQTKIGKVAKKIKRISEKGVTLIEGLVSTAIIGIGFVAVFQKVENILNRKETLTLKVMLVLITIK